MGSEMCIRDRIVIAENHGLNARVFSSPASALEVAKQAAKSQDLIYIGGSTFVVAEILS